MVDPNKSSETATRRPWRRPTVDSVGTVADVLRGGQGKVSVLTGDPGEAQKVPATEK